MDIPAPFSAPRQWLASAALAVLACTGAALALPAAAPAEAAAPLVVADLGTLPTLEVRPSAPLLASTGRDNTTRTSRGRANGDMQPLVYRAKHRVWRRFVSLRWR